MAKDDHHSGAITIPPLVFLAAFAVGLVIDHFRPAAVLPDDVQYVAGGIVGAVSIAIAAAAVVMFVKHRTSIHVHRPTTALITDGPFRLSRNPAYLALILLYSAGAIAVDSVWVMLMLAPAIFVLYRGVIVREERYLERLFGDAYRDYKTRVRRWL